MDNQSRKKKCSYIFITITNVRKGQEVHNGKLHYSAWNVSINKIALRNHTKIVYLMLSCTSLTTDVKVRRNLSDSGLAPVKSVLLSKKI